MGDEKWTEWIHWRDARHVWHGVSYMRSKSMEDSGRSPPVAEIRPFGGIGRTISAVVGGDIAATPAP